MGTENNTQQAESPHEGESRVRSMWNGWTESITENRSHSDGWVRLEGFLQQLILESVVYMLIANGVALLSFLVHVTTPFVIMSEPWVIYPGIVGISLTVLYYIAFDEWVRPEGESTVE